MVDERHARQPGHQHILLEGGQVDEGTQLPGEVTVVGQGGFLGGVCGEGHGEVTTPQHQLQQVVHPVRLREGERRERGERG